MDYQQYNHRLFVGFAAAILILAGCAPQIQKPAQVCPGKKSAAESLSLLRLRLENTSPLKANGQLRLQYYADEKKHKENFPVKLWGNPPTEIYLQGDVAFDPKGIVLGSNENEFWMAIKLKEISSYWWGRWPEESCPQKLMISPGLVLEALGIVEVGDEENWSLSNEGASDVLTKQQGSTRTRKIYINNCDYLVRRIEYFDDDSRAVAVTELDKYKEISKDFFVPSVIKIVNLSEDGGEDLVSVTLNLKSIKPANFNDKQCDRLFTRPQPQGFKHIYKIVDGNIIEQPQ